MMRMFAEQAAYASRAKFQREAARTARSRRDWLGMIKAQSLASEYKKESVKYRDRGREIKARWGDTWKKVKPVPIRVGDNFATELGFLEVIDIKPGGKVELFSRERTSFYFRYTREVREWKRVTPTPSLPRKDRATAGLADENNSAVSYSNSLKMRE